MRKPLTSGWRDVGRALLGLSAVWLVVAAVPAAAQTAADRPVTFTKDIAPILQKSCQRCHRPDSIAPMSLLTYDQVRPYARAIKQRTQLAYVPGMRGVMPPWFLERNIGIQQIKGDFSLSDAEIATIAKWADSGAPEGNRADMPPPLVFVDNDSTAWTIGKPDLILVSPPVTVKANAADWWGDLPDTPNPLTEDRYAAAAEYKEINNIDVKSGALERKNENTNTSAGLGKRPIGVFHHGGMLAVGSIEPGYNAFIYPADAGKLIAADRPISWSGHVHAPGSGQDVTAVLNVGLKFHPKGYKPKYDLVALQINSSELDIRPDSDNLRHDAYWVAAQPFMLMNFEPHLHASGIRMCFEAIHQRAIETLSCAGYDHNWVRNYQYEENAAPLLPKGTVLHLIAWFDGTAKNANVIDPRNAAMWGRRSVMNMFGVLAPETRMLTDEEYAQELAKRRDYLERTQGWDTVVGCPGCFDAPAPRPAQAAAAR